MTKADKWAREHERRQRLVDVQRDAIERERPSYSSQAVSASLTEREFGGVGVVRVRLNGTPSAADLDGLLAWLGDLFAEVTE